MVVNCKLFIDTMIFLHFRPLDELDLRSRAEADSVTLVMPRVTLRELDKHKSSHSSRKVRERARRVLTEIETAITTNQPLKGGIPVELFPEHPADHLERLHLNPDWADDVLVASVIAYKEQTGNNDVIVITQDTGPRLTCRHHDIQTVKLDDKSALPEELDDVERENRALQQQLQRLQTAVPRLESAFVGSDSPCNVANFLLSQPPNIDENRVAAVLAEVRKKYPKKGLPGSSPSAAPQDGPPTRAGMMMDMVDRYAVSPERLVEYNAQLDRYYREVEAFLRELHEFREPRSRTISFTIEIRNLGTAPADDVDVKFYFPGGFRLMVENELPAEPGEPCPPEKPVSRLEELTRSLNSTYQLADLQPAIPNFSSASTFRIEETNSYTVTDHFARIKHGIPAMLPQMYLEFASLSEANSFKCTYELRPANLADPVIGELHFVVRTSGS